MPWITSVATNAELANAITAVAIMLVNLAWWRSTVLFTRFGTSTHPGLFMAASMSETIGWSLLSTKSPFFAWKSNTFWTSF